MSMQKKLKRGLADLSSFFAQPVPVAAEQKNRIGLLAIQPPKHPNFQKPSRPSLITASILSCSSLFKTSDVMELTHILKDYFADVHFASLTPEQLEPFMHPQLNINASQTEPSKDQQVLILFDWNMLTVHALYELLDHCVLIIEADTKQMMHGFEAMKKTLSQNPNLHCSLFLVGKGSEYFSELIYERFSEMISHFLGHNLGFLGWTENQEICINPDLLKEEADSSLGRYSKIHLSHLLYV